MQTTNTNVEINDDQFTLVEDYENSPSQMFNRTTGLGSCTTSCKNSQDGE